jgi:1,2-diacylglycerol 3-beta-galactosyltransferase
MILRPSFYEAPASTLTRRDLGLDEGMPTAIIMFGGYGSAKAAAIVDELARVRPEVQSIVMCGHNKNLYEALQGRPLCHPVGFTNDVAGYMRLADIFIGKPGPGSISEALHLGLPVIVECNRRTMVQERYNAAWVEENGLGMAFKNIRELPDVIKRIVGTDRLQAMRANIARLDNRAVFEIPALFERIMALPQEQRNDRAA